MIVQWKRDLLRYFGFSSVFLWVNYSLRRAWVFQSINFVLLSMRELTVDKLTLFCSGLELDNLSLTQLEDKARFNRSFIRWKYFRRRNIFLFIKNISGICPSWTLATVNIWVSPPSSSGTTNTFNLLRDHKVTLLHC